MSHRVLFVVYHDIDTNGRSQQILRCCEILGKTTLVTYHKPETFCVGKETEVIESGNGKRDYIAFLRTAKKEISGIKPDIVVLHDNYCAPLITYIKKRVSSSYIVYDSSELYIDIKMGGIKGSIAYFIQKQENRNLKHADFVIAANSERARIMHDFFHLREVPYVFENIRQITEQYNETECDNKFKKYISKEKFIVFYLQKAFHHF